MYSYTCHYDVQLHLSLDIKTRASMSLLYKTSLDIMMYSYACLHTAKLLLSMLPATKQEAFPVNMIYISTVLD